MRISVFLGNLGTGGAERVAVWLANTLSDLGHDVSVVTLAPIGADAYPVSAKVKRVSLDSFGEHRGAVAKILATAKRILALRRYLRVSRSDAVVAFMTQESVMAILATRGMHSRCIVSERNAPWLRNPSGLWHWGRQSTYRLADAVVVQTEDVAVWVRRNTAALRTMIIPNAALGELAGNDAVLHPNSLIPPGRRVLLAVGSKPHQKGFDLLVAAFSQVAAQLPEWDLVLLGVDPVGAEQSPQISKLLSYIEECGLSRRVHLPGRVGNMVDWYDVARVFVLSSRFEGMPNALLEAMAVGTACVSFDCPTGPRALIRDGENGILVPPEDVDALSVALKRLARDEDLCKRLGVQALGVRETHDAERITYLWEQVIMGSTAPATTAMADSRKRTI